MKKQNLNIYQRSWILVAILFLSTNILIHGQGLYDTDGEYKLYGSGANWVSDPYYNTGEYQETYQVQNDYYILYDTEIEWYCDYCEIDEYGANTYQIGSDTFSDLFKHYDNETPQINVSWDVNTNTHTIYASILVGPYYDHEGTLEVIITEPSTPQTPTATNFPGYTRVTRGAPINSNVVTWYWQESSNGKSKDNSDPYIDRTSGSRVYLRAYNSLYNLWSGSSSYVDYTIDPSTVLSDENYVYTIAPQIGTTNVSLLNDDQKIETVSYFDGLGRPKQSIGIRAGGNGEDVVTYIGYDAYGRQDKEYLPYATTTNGGSYRNDAFNPTFGFYNTTKYENTLNPYSEKHLEASPLSRVLEQGSPGADWAVNKTADTDRTIKFDYRTNTDIDYVKQYRVSFVNNNTEIPQLVDNGIIYPANELFKTVTKDENWKPNQTYPNDHTTEEYKDKLGRVIMKRTFNMGKWHDTYYVYDDYGNLTYVLPPKMSTYYKITQQDWVGQKYYDNVTGLFVGGSGNNQVSFSFSSNGYLNLYIYGYDNGNQVQLANGLLLNLDFVPSLPDMNLGVVEEYYGTEVGTAYIQDGNLYINSNGTNFTEIDYFVSVDLSNYQTGFTPPPIDQTQLDNLAYQYRYDGRNRLIEKKIPGKGTATDWEEIVYNKLDQPILTRDPNLKALGKWLFTKYDAFGRVAYTGVMNSTGTRANLQSTVDGYATQYEIKNGFSTTIAGTPVYYGNASYPQTISEVHTINYYDNYTFDGFTSMPSNVDGQPIVNHDNDGSTQKETKGLATGSKVRVLGTNPVKWITTITGYDTKGRAIYVKSVNDYLGTTDIVENTLDFTGKVNQAKTTHKKTGQIDIVTMDAFVYDHAGRLVSHKQNINNQGEELIAKNHYDELGQLVKKDVGHTELQPLQQIDYAYNIRGWLKNINDPTNLGQDGDLFSFGLSYNRPEGSYNTLPLYNGNISNTYWKTDNESSALRYYGYRYDALNRFTSAYYSENNSYRSWFNEYINNYDRNGNIGNLSRYGQHPTNSQYGHAMDNLTYTYDGGNKLLAVKDIYGTNVTSNSMGGFKDGNTSGDDYAYDTNGNLTKDSNKGITTIEYNLLNLPTKIRFGYDDDIQYVYDALGSKLSKKVYRIDNYYVPIITDYAGGFVYKDNILQFFSQPEGYIEAKNENDLSQGFDYIYQYKDHLGNIRLSYRDMDHDGDVEGATSPVFYDDLDSSSSGWDSVGALYGTSAPIDSAHALSGNSAIKLHKASEGNIYAHSNEWITISNTQATDYIFSGWVYVETTGSANASWARLVFFMNEATEATYFTLVDHSDQIYTKNRWVYLEKKVSVPANIDKINLRVGVYNNYNYSPSVTAWFDNLSIRKVNDPQIVEILEENNYYPFGLEHKGYNNSPVTNHPYKYQGKELNEELGLDWYDFGARNYDASLGRWMNLDPLAEILESEAPFNYALNNPIYYRDLDGRAPKGMLDPYLIFNGKDNKLYIYDDNDTPDDKSDDVLLGTFDAHNNVARSSQGKWEDGTYDMFDKTKRRTRGSMETVNLPLFYYYLHLNLGYTDLLRLTYNRSGRKSVRVKQDSDYGGYGNGGIYRAVSFTQSDGKNRSGMAVHSGRLHKSFFSRVTFGCIRTTNEAMMAIDNAIKEYGPLSTITVEGNKSQVRSDVEPVNNIAPASISLIPTPAPSGGTIDPIVISGGTNMPPSMNVINIPPPRID